MAKVPRPRKKIQGALDDLCLQLQNVLALAKHQGYLIEMRTLESNDGDRKVGRIVLATPEEGFIPFVEFRLYLPVDRSDVPVQTFKVDTEEEDGDRTSGTENNRH